MQRLFSTFPGGSPGTGLLFLRFGTGIPLAQCAITALSSPPLGGSVACNMLAAVTGVPLLAGLWTPVAATVLAIDELWLAISQPAAAWTHLPLCFWAPAWLCSAPAHGPSIPAFLEGSVSICGAGIGHGRSALLPPKVGRDSTTIGAVMQLHLGLAAEGNSSKIKSVREELSLWA